MNKPKRVALALTWIVPAAVLAIAGVAKLLDPNGVQPLVLADFISPAAWPVWLRGLGAFELLLAVLLALPRTRLPAGLAAFALLALFSGFAAVNAADTRFLENCGCLGDLRVRPEGAMSPLYWTVLRNAFLGGLLMLGHLLGSSRERGIVHALEQAALVMAVLALAPLYAGERVLQRDGEERLEAIQTGNVHLTRTDWKLPDLPLVDATGTQTTAAAALRGGDVLVFFRTECPVCVRRAPGWARLAVELQAEGRRLMLVALDSRDAIEAFKKEHGLSALEHVAMANRRDATKLGIFGVPTMLGLDARRRVAFVEGEATARSLAESLDLVSRHVDGLERHVWQRVVVAIFGEGHALGALPSEAGEVLPVRGPDGGDHQLHLLRAPANTGAYLEIAVGVDAAGVVRGLAPLQAGRYLRFLDPALEQAREFAGLSIKDALARARAHADERTHARRLWMSFAYALAALEQRLPAHKTPPGSE